MNENLKKLISVILLTVCIFFASYTILAQDIGIANKTPQTEEQTKTTIAQDKKVEAVITKMLEEKEITIMGKKQQYQKLELLLTEGDSKGKTITVVSGDIPLSKIQHYKVGDKIIVSINKDSDGKDNSFISDYVRRDSLYWLFFIFIGLAIVIAKGRGLASVIGMVISFFVIFKILLPQILAGANPIFISIMTSLIIIPVTFYLSHGVNVKTTMSVLGTLIALIFTGILAYFYINFSQLSGYASEESTFLQSSMPNVLNMQGILLAGIIIGLLGILDDITISQAAIVYQLKKTSPKLKFKELYSKGMDIGSDHIASMVNTLILVYAGAAMPLLLLFVNNPHPFTEVLNYEMIAEEIVRTLVASIGLILAVPITTFLTAYYMKDNKR